MANPLRLWRQHRRETGFWKKARDRSAAMAEPALMAEIDLSIMMMGQALTRYRNAGNRDGQLDQMFELRMNLEACLGMLENVLPD